MQIDRRGFLGAGAAAALSGLSLEAGSANFSFVHFTDLHIQPELRADVGCRACVARINALRPDFAICGGDLVYDVNDVNRSKATALYDLYGETVKSLHAPLHTVVGNHDVFGTYGNSGVTSADPLYGKRMFEDRIGPLYRSFDHEGWHFVLLDSIGVQAGNFYGTVDDDQLTWLENDLARMPAGAPLIVVTHIPLASSVLQFVADPGKKVKWYLVANAREVVELLWPYKPKLVLQGHTHVREVVTYNGCQFITSGAVCGNWWKGAREGHPEGFGVVTVRGGNATWRYETYDFVASPPPATSK
jgi:3',5'-cyclic AMP phosphodiesterase CpdA